MAIKPDGGSAFPDFKQDGMSLRDYFAGQAMQGILAQPGMALDIDGGILGKQHASLAYAIADAMITERTK